MKEQYYIQDHHDPIVSREIWDKAQELLKKQSWHNWKRREQYRLIPVRTGLLQGFVSISPEWKTVSLTRLISATQKVRGTVFKEPTDDDQSEVRKENKESEERIMAEKEILKEFVEVDWKRVRVIR